MNRERELSQAITAGRAPAHFFPYVFPLDVFQSVTVFTTAT